MPRTKVRKHSRVGTKGVDSHYRFKSVLLQKKVPHNRKPRKDKGKKRGMYSRLKSYHIINMETGKIIRSGIEKQESVDDMIQDDFGEETHIEFYGTDNQAKIQARRWKRWSKEALEENG